MAENNSEQERVNFLQPDALKTEGDIDIAPVRETAEANAPETRPEDAPADAGKKKNRLFLPPKIREVKNTAPGRDEVYIKVEKILEEDLREQYERMSPVARQEFKLRGEETGRAILEILRSARVQAKKIFRLIADWLALIPGVNRFFLEQEAKIKTDKIIAIKNPDGH